MSNPTDNSATIRTVVLDYGEVLCFPPTPEEIARMARVFQLDPARFWKIYHTSRAAYDRAEFTAVDYWRHFASQAGVELRPHSVDDLRQWDLDMWSSTNAPMLEWLERLRSAGIKTAILSNMPTEMVTHVRKNFAWIDLFDHQIFSADVRQIKPEPEIYQTCLQVIGSRPAETLFVDDREANLVTARAAGIFGLRFHSVEQLRSDLQTLGFPVLPPPIGGSNRTGDHPVTV
jgi:putative hydrolase of the HAD superfamily